MDDLFSRSKDEDTAFAYMAAQLEVAAGLRLLLSLLTSKCVVVRLEFVGIDIELKYTMPAKSKHGLLQT